ncbi:hypothetical protein [uncultured Roseibium sp.]|uniref:hypothetical protein n=1 Tax=uncultured Roseibium sp. TaxID=1936171 RepID=UPI003216F3DE
MGAAFNKRFAVGLSAFLLLTAFISPEQARNMQRNPSTFGTMLCRQFWYLENKILAEGRVCLKSDRARRAFKTAKPCISDDENVLPRRVRDYLAELRRAAAKKGCFR